MGCTFPKSTPPDTVGLLTAEGTATAIESVTLQKGDSFEVSRDEFSKVHITCFYDELTPPIDPNIACHIYTYDKVIDRIDSDSHRSKDGAVVAADQLGISEPTDREAFSIAFDKVNTDITTFIFIMTIGSNEVTTDDMLRNIGMRITDSKTGSTIAIHRLDATPAKEGFVFGSINRSGKNWDLKIISDTTDPRCPDLDSFLAPKPKWKKMTLTVHNGKNLAPKDGSGTSDPYFEVEWAGNKKKTKHLARTLNPEWDWTESMHSNQYANQDLIIRVWDYDVLTENDYMGEIMIEGSNLVEGFKVNHAFYPLECSSKHKGEKVSGGITLSVSVA
mmetsp:Transcript_7187/g.7894  ORF Transcript_7187/g.7894 Transcript_7187/m.7894 type:complete len:332 (+) Transcript_7187:54-1049(+)